MDHESDVPRSSVADRLTYRAIRPADAEAVTALMGLPGFRFGTLRPAYPSPERTRRWIEGLPETQTALVAVLDDAIVATGDLSRHGGRRAHAANIGLGVHDAWVGRGIGSGLLRELLMVADRWLGLRRVELTVYSDNARAIGLYRRCGFAVEGTLRGYALRDGVFVDALAMARLVMPGAVSDPNA